jgi:hypothetical protein
MNQPSGHLSNDSAADSAGGRVLQTIDRVNNDLVGEWRMASGEWRMANGEWRVANGEWRVASGEWRMANGEWRVANGEW